MLTRIMQVFNSWRRYGTAVKELSRLSDWELADIGISRSEISRLAHEHANSMEKEVYPQPGASHAPGLCLECCD